MKENSTDKISLKVLAIVFVVIFAVSGFAYIYNYKTLNNLTRKKMNVERRLKRIKSEVEDLLIQKQKLLAQDRIEKIATSELGLVPNKSVNEKISVDKRELDYIKKIVKSKYE
jgi:cell division protein FtsL